MARIYRREDRIPVRIGDITVKLSPLSIQQKTEIMQSAINGRKNADYGEANKSVVLALKYAIKGIEGVEDSEGKPYVLQFEGESLTDACVGDLLNLGMTGKLTQVCISLANGIKDEFTDERGEKLEGVDIVKASTPEKNS